MKRLLAIVFVVLLAAAIAYLYFDGAIPGHTTDGRILKDKTRRFLECIKFKEFEEAAAFHNEADRKDADIAGMIEGLFYVPPEYLDIQDVNVLFAEIDSSGVLGKVKARCFAEFLNTKESKNHDVLLYWKKENEDWFLKLKSSLE